MLRESFLNVHWLSCFRAGCFLPTNYLTLRIFMKTICSFHFEQKLKQLNIIFLIVYLLWKEKQSLFFLQSANFLQKYKIEQIQTVKTNLPYTSSCSIFKSNLIIPLKESLKNISSCCVIFLTYIFLNLCPFHSWRSAIFLRSVTMTTHRPSLVTHARDIWWTLDFANAFVSPGVNSRGELVTLA